MNLYAALASLSAEYGRQDGLSALQEDWSGIGFRLGTWSFLVPQSEVAEVLAPPRVTRVPGAPEWVRGLANLRGTVIPLFDLGHLLLGSPTPRQSRNRYLVLASNDNPAAFLVDAVSGLRRFSVSQMGAANTAGLPEALHPFVRGQFSSGEEQRSVFSLRAVLTRRLAAQIQAQET